MRRRWRWPGSLLLIALLAGHHRRNRAAGGVPGVTGRAAFRRAGPDNWAVGHRASGSTGLLLASIRPGHYGNAHYGRGSPIAIGRASHSTIAGSTSANTVTAITTINHIIQSINAAGRAVFWLSSWGRSGSRQANIIYIVAHAAGRRQARRAPPGQIATGPLRANIRQYRLQSPAPRALAPLRPAAPPAALPCAVAPGLSLRPRYRFQAQISRQ